MKRTQLVGAFVGAILALLGLGWFLQGAGILPGSLMTGSQFWEVAGAVTFVVGLLIIALGARHTGTT